MDLPRQQAVLSIEIGSFHKLGLLVVGVLRINLYDFRVYIRAPDCWKRIVDESSFQEILGQGKPSVIQARAPAKK